jgi:serine phosphatase RsbU (regulator of sigma subunit)
MIALFLATCYSTVYSQNAAVDSIVGLIKKNSLNDTVLVKLYNQVGELNYSYEPDSAIRCWERVSAICEKRLQEKLAEREKKVYLTEQSAALNNIGFVYQTKGDALASIRYLKRSLLVAMIMKDYSSAAITLNNIGHNLAYVGDNVGALDYYNQSLSMITKHGSKKEAIIQLAVMGDMYATLQDESNAIKYMNKALKIAIEINDRNNIAYIETLLGNVNFKFEKYQEALKHDSISLGIYKEIKNEAGICTAYNNIGARNYAMRNYEAALSSFEQSLVLREKLNEVKSLHSNLINIGTTLVFLKRNKEGYERLNQSLELARKNGDKVLEFTSLRQIGNSYFTHEKDYNKAEKYAYEALDLSQKIGYAELTKQAAKLLMDTYSKLGNYKKGMEMQELYMAMKDSLSNAQTRKAALNSQLKYEYEVKAAADSVRLAADKELSVAQLQQEKTKGYALYGGLALTVLFGGFMFNRYKKTNRQKKIIEQKERETNYQKSLIENKNREILDSISYAKRLQEAILPPENMWRRNFGDSFILYKPKDIIAGDFYWNEISNVEENQLIFFAAADCTGHGVPGAMVSVVCSNALTRTVNEFHITEPGKILDKVKELVIQTFEKSESEVKDGMDISLCALNRHTGELQWAGANNPLWIIRKGAQIIEEIKGDKQPVGKHIHSKPFATHTVSIQEGDRVYLFTDGFADQFGGEKGKKFKLTKMKELLVSIGSKNMEEQKIVLNDTFENWKGALEQIDDVCVIGIKL